MSKEEEKIKLIRRRKTYQYFVSILETYRFKQSFTLEEVLRIIYSVRDEFYTFKSKSASYSAYESLEQAIKDFKEGRI